MKMKGKLIVLTILATIGGLIYYNVSFFTNRYGAPPKEPAGTAMVSVPPGRSSVPGSSMVEAAMSFLKTEPLKQAKLLRNSVMQKIVDSLRKEKWGRNPFLSREEMEMLKGTAAQKVVKKKKTAKSVTTGATTAEEKIERAKKLTAIIIRPTGKIAIIDNRILREGDRIKDEVLVKIEKNRVWLRAYKRRERARILRLSACSGRITFKD